MNSRISGSTTTCGRRSIRRASGGRWSKVSPYERRFVRRVFTLGGRRLERGAERRLRVVVSDDSGTPVVRVLDAPDRLPIFEIRCVGVVSGLVTTRRDYFPGGFPQENIRLAARAASRFR